MSIDHPETPRPLPDRPNLRHLKDQIWASSNPLLAWLRRLDGLWAGLERSA